MFRIVPFPSYLPPDNIYYHFYNFNIFPSPSLINYFRGRRQRKRSGQHLQAPQAPKENSRWWRKRRRAEYLTRHPPLLPSTSSPFLSPKRRRGSEKPSASWKGRKSRIPSPPLFLRNFLMQIMKKKKISPSPPLPLPSTLSPSHPLFVLPCCVFYPIHLQLIRNKKQTARMLKWTTVKTRYLSFFSFFSIFFLLFLSPPPSSFIFPPSFLLTLYFNLLSFFHPLFSLLYPPLSLSSPLPLLIPLPPLPHPSSCSISLLII